MATGDILFQQSGMYLAEEHEVTGSTVTALNASGGNTVTIKKVQSGVNEGTFTSGKTYKVTVEEA